MPRFTILLRVQLRRWQREGDLSRPAGDPGPPAKAAERSLPTQVDRQLAKAVEYLADAAK